MGILLHDLRRFVSKLRVYTISDQDNAGRWLRITFPELFDPGFHFGISSAR